MAHVVEVLHGVRDVNRRLCLRGRGIRGQGPGIRERSWRCRLMRSMRRASRWCLLRGRLRGGASGGSVAPPDMLKRASWCPERKRSCIQRKR